MKTLEEDIQFVLDNPVVHVDFLVHRMSAHIQQGNISKENKNAVYKHFILLQKAENEVCRNK